MDFRLLGPLEASSNGDLLPLGGPKQRALLAVLCLHVNQVVAKDRLIDDLWGERPPKAASAYLQNCVSRLRASLGEGWIRTRPPGYVLTADVQTIDARRFERLVAAARGLEARERASGLREALALWRGPALADFAYDAFAQAEIAHLEELRLSATEERIAADVELGLHAELVGELEALVARHPTHEPLRRLQMLALHRSGRSMEALRAYEELRLQLIELTLEPGEDVRAVERMILDQDPALAFGGAAAATPARRERRTVTGLYLELRLDDDLDPADAPRVLSSCLAAIRQVVAGHGGALEQLLGDEAVALFGVPPAHEDDAVRGVRAAVEIRDRLAREPVDVRIALEAGVMLVGEERGLAAAAVAAARRLEDSAGRREILLGPAALRLTAAAVEVIPIDGTAGYRLLQLVQGAPAVPRHLDGPLVDRARELAQIEAAIEQTLRERACRKLVVVGEPGIGKSRLAGEAAKIAGNRTLTLVGHCVAYGDGATYLPLADLLQAAVGPGEPAVRIADRLGSSEDAAFVGQRLAGACSGFATAGSSGETFWAARRFFETLARELPLLVVLEDVHWAEPTFLDLVEYLTGSSRDAPMLLLCLARPELLEMRPGWARDAVALGPLDPGDARTLLDRLPERADVPDGVTGIVLETAEGNPLFLEQLAAHAVEQAVAAGDVPPTLEALLTSRLDQLGNPERELLERAAIVGRSFAREELEALCSGEQLGAVGPGLMALTRRQLVAPDPAAPATQDGFRFQHVLIRDVAYAAVPTALKADLHERLARRLAQRPDEPDELVGYHLEQASGYLAQCDAGERSRLVARDAGAKLGAAGIRAWKRGDAPAGVNLLTRAAALLPHGDAFRLSLLPELGVALRATGELRRAEEVLAASATCAAAAHETRAELRARLELANVRLLSDPGGRAEELVETATRAIPVFEAAADERSLARAWRLIGHVEGAMRCRYGASAEAVERALAHERQSGWSTAACLGDLAAALYYGPTPAAEAITRCRGLLEQADRGGEANVLVHLGALEAMQGDFAEARRLVLRSHAIFTDLGQSLLAQTNCEGVRGQIELLAGNPDAAWSALRTSHDALEAAGDHAYAATRAAELSEAAYRKQRLEEAWRWSELAERAGAADDIPTQFMWRGVRAKLLAADGRLEEAEAVARRAAQLAKTTDAVSQTAAVVLTLAEIYLACGKPKEAAQAAQESLGLFLDKGNVVAAGHARELVATVSPS